jgi:hypothetical protein
VSTWENCVGATDEWYTPPEVFLALGVTFDLDVSPARFGASHVPATRFLEGDGLIEPWNGFVWMNPPYGGRNALDTWLVRFFEHSNGIALVPDRTSTLWFWDAWQKSTLCLFSRKIKFQNPDGSRGKQPSNGSAFFAAGPRGAAALENAAKANFGILGKPVVMEYDL